MMASVKNCFREPIAQFADAAKYLDDSVTAHLAGQTERAGQLIRRADLPEIREWTESIWGRGSFYVKRQRLSAPSQILPNINREATRMPTSAEKHELHVRDGFHCRFCGIPVIRREIRMKIVKTYPHDASWGKKNAEQHAALQAMWAQYDHVIPHSLGGTTSFENMVITCAPCNFGRMESTLEEVGLADPRSREPVRSQWDGLERFR